MQEPRELFRRFRPQATPARTKTNLRIHRSLFNLSKSVDDETVPPVEEPKRAPSKYSGLGRKMPRIFRWGGAKKAIITETSIYTSGETARPAGDEGGFLGHLGIGHYIASDETAFLNCEGSEDTNIPVHQGYSKSLVNLSSITPWSQSSFDSVGLLVPGSKTESDRDSVSTSSNCDVSGTSPAQGTRPSLLDLRRKRVKSCNPMPELIKTLFFTNLPVDGSSSTGVDTLTNSDDTPRKHLEEDEDPNAFLPALLITEAPGLLPNKTYTVYRTADYPGELRSSIQWLEAELKPSHRSRRSTRRRSPSVPRFAADLRTRRATPDGRRKSGTIVPAISPIRRGKSSEALNSSNMREQVSERTAPVLQKDDMKSILDCLVKALEKLEASAAAPKDGTLSSKTGVSNAWIVKSEPLSWHQSEVTLAQLVPEVQHAMDPTKELQRIYREETILYFKVPQGLSDSRVELHEDNFRKATLGLTSTHLFLTEASVRRRSTHSLARFQYVLPLSQLWFYEGTPYHKKKVELSTFQNLITRSSFTTPVSEDFQKGFTLQDSESNPDSGVSESESELMLIGCPPSDNWILRFPNSTIYKIWRKYLHDAIASSRDALDGRSLYVKILNQVADNQVVYKYLKVDIHTNVEELVTTALQSMNLEKSTEAQLLVLFSDEQGDQKELLLLGPENPFLIAVVLTFNWLTRMSSDRPDSMCSSPNTAVFHTPTEPIDVITKLVNDAVNQYVGSSDWDTFVSHLPDEDPLLPRDQVRADFILRAKESGSKIGRKLRARSMLKPSDLKKTPNTAPGSKTRKQKEVRGKTKSSMALNDDVNRKMSPLRGARSMNSLNLCSENYEIFGQVPAKLWPDAKLPQSLVNLFVIIYHAGVDIEGIFRRSTAVNQIQAMQLKVDTNVEPITVYNCPPLVAAGVLKRFYGEIPGHLLGDENWDDWVQVVRTSSVDERMFQMEALIKKLPKVNQTLLTLLIHLLSHIRDHEHLNRMSTEALGTVWGPNIIQRPNSTPNHEDALLASQIVVCLLHPQFTASILSDSTGMNRELLRYYQSCWQAMEESTQNESLYDTVGSTSRQMAFRFSGSQEESSNASSVRSDMGFVEDKLKKKQASSYSPHLSNTTSSSAESQNASPILTGSRAFMSPALSDRRNPNCLPRRMLQLRPEGVLPDQPASIRTDVDSGRTMIHGTLPANSEKLSETPPVVPPRTSKSGGAVIQMLPSKQRTEPSSSSSQTPKVLPRAKLRTRDSSQDSVRKSGIHKQAASPVTPTTAPEYSPMVTPKRRPQESRRKTLTVCYHGSATDISSGTAHQRDSSYHAIPRGTSGVQRDAEGRTQVHREMQPSKDDAYIPTAYQTRMPGPRHHDVDFPEPTPNTLAYRRTRQQQKGNVDIRKEVRPEVVARTRQKMTSDQVQRSPKSSFSPANDVHCLPLSVPPRKAEPIKSSFIFTLPVTQTSSYLHPNSTRSSRVKRSDSSPDSENARCRACVRRKSSHASSVSTESNTLVCSSVENLKSSS